MKKIINKTFKYRIYPTKEQEVLFAKHFGCKRFVYNYFLNLRKEEYLNNQNSLNYYDTARILTDLKQKEETVWLKEVNSQSIQSALRDLDVAYNRFFKGLGGYPVFKGKFGRQSFKIPQFVEYANGILWIPKFKTPIKVKEDRPLTGKILFAVVSKSKTNKYFVAITVETEYKPYKQNKKTIGVDLGIKTLAVCSDGKQFENIKITKTFEKKLAFEQRQLSKKIKGSSNRNKQRLKVAKIHETISNIRLNHIHLITTQLIRENQTICVEDLSVENMIKNRCLAKSIADASWGEFLRQLKYKADWNSRAVLQVGRFFPSSKTCFNCNFVNQGLSLDDRIWTCPCCGTILDRDLNAARNIMRQALNDQNSGCGMQSEPKQKHVEALTIVKSTKHETQRSLDRE